MTVADRRTGGDPGTCYYIMLGADVDVGAFEGCAKPEDSTDAARGFEGVLCKLEHFTNGRLEVTPAFAGPDPRFVGMVFDGSDGGDDKDDFYVGNGAPLLTSRIATPAGRVFEYVVENASAPTDEEMVQLLEEELKEEVQRMEERRDRDPIIPPLVPPPPQCRGFGVSMELVSLVGFPPGVELYAEYEVHLPPGWRAETPRGDDHGRTWTENDEGGLCCAGTSQLARSVLRPCRAAHGSKRSAEDPSVARHAPARRGRGRSRARRAAAGRVAARAGLRRWPSRPASGPRRRGAVRQTSPHGARGGRARRPAPRPLRRAARGRLRRRRRGRRRGAAVAARAALLRGRLRAAPLRAPHRRGLRPLPPAGEAAPPEPGAAPDLGARRAHPRPAPGLLSGGRAPAQGFEIRRAPARRVGRAPRPASKKLGLPLQVRVHDARGGLY